MVGEGEERHSVLRSAAPILSDPRVNRPRGFTLRAYRATKQTNKQIEAETGLAECIAQI